MKATKKIVGAACALVAAVALSAGSTFAWFSTNGSVDATGMKIEVSTNNAYLIIADSQANLKNEGTTMELVSSQTALKPSAYRTVKKDEEGAVVKDEEGKITTEDKTTKAYNTEGSIDKETSWYTAQGTNATDGTLNGDITKLSADDFSKYVVVDEIFVAVSKGSTAVESVVMSVTATPTWTATNGTKEVVSGEGEEATTTVGTNNSAISVVILYQTINADNTTLTTWKMAELTQAGNEYGGANHTFLSTGDDEVTTTSNVLDLGGIAPSSTYGNYIQIRVMVYFDGNNADVNTSNSANLAGVTLNFNFSDPAQAESSGD